MKNLIPSSLLAAIPGWENLDTKSQALVESETQLLGESIASAGFARLAMAEHLVKIQSILEPKRMFVRYMSVLNLKKATVYKAIKSFKHAKGAVTETTLHVAMARNIPLLGEDPKKPLGRYSEVAKRFPEPLSPTPRESNLWLDQLEAAYKRRQNNEVPRVKEGDDPDVLLKACYRSFYSAMKKLPRNSRTKRIWFERLVGMCLAELGISNDITFSPQAAPEDFKPVVGRPRIIDAEAAA